MGRHNEVSFFDDIPKDMAYWQARRDASLRDGYVIDLASGNRLQPDGIKAVADARQPEKFYNFYPDVQTADGGRTFRYSLLRYRATPADLFTRGDNDGSIPVEDALAGNVYSPGIYPSKSTEKVGTIYLPAVGWVPGQKAPENLPRIRVMESKTGDMVLATQASMQGYMNEMGVRYSHDENSMAIKTKKNEILVYQLKKGQGPDPRYFVLQPQIGEDEFVSLAFNSNGDLIATTATGKVLSYPVDWK